MSTSAPSVKPASAKAYAPSHITGFFQIFEKGSTGAGVNTELGAVTEVLVEPDGEGEHISINGAESAAPVSRRVIEKFRKKLRGKLTVEHEIQYPIGYGMGMSGAGAFSLALALNEAAGDIFSRQECMEIAVSAEIESGTGLGDVVAQQFAGVMIGLRPYPSRTVETIPTSNERAVCAFFEPLDTGKIIRDIGWKTAINLAGERCMEELLTDKRLENFMRLSRQFTFETGLASARVREVLEAVPEASMAMLGQTAFAVTSEYERIAQAFGRFTDRISVCRLATHGAEVL